MTGQQQEPTPTNYDYEKDELDTLADEFKEKWSPEEPKNDGAEPDPEAVQAAAESVGFTNREPKRTQPAPKEGSLTIRAEVKQIKRYKDLAKAQKPKWPHGYLLERALDALEKELKG